MRGVVFMKMISQEELEEDEFYNARYLEESVEDDEINGEEEGFMIGYLAE